MTPPVPRTRPRAVRPPSRPVRDVDHAVGNVQIRPSPPPGTPASGPTTSALSEAGRRYAADLARLAGGAVVQPRHVRAAERAGVTPRWVREAVALKAAVDTIAANCGESAKSLLLSDHPRLSAAVVMRINPGAKAHLVHFAASPSFAAFRRRVAVAVGDHAAVYVKVVEYWSGAGWPAGA